MKENKSIYIMFSSTECAIGSFIRKMTHNTYNHVSVSLDANLEKLYSFARFYASAPFYAGFVEESSLRYMTDGTAKIKLCKLDVTEEGYDAALRLLDEVEAEKDKYIYNFASAACFLKRRRVAIPRAYTCVEFAAKVLSTAGVPINGDEYYSIIDLEKKFDSEVIFEGGIDSYDCRGDWGNDRYLSSVTRRRYAASALFTLCKLAYRAAFK